MGKRKGKPKKGRIYSALLETTCRESWNLPKPLNTRAYKISRVEVGLKNKGKMADFRLFI